MAADAPEEQLHLRILDFDAIVVEFEKRAVAVSEESKDRKKYNRGSSSLGPIIEVLKDPYRAYDEKMRDVELLLSDLAKGRSSG